jgi:hypothetical protein
MFQGRCDMAGPSGLESVPPVDPDADQADLDGAEATAGADPEIALVDYAELARLLRAADAAGDGLAMAQIRDEMDRIWPALTQEQRLRIDDGEFDW